MKIFCFVFLFLFFHAELAHLAGLGFSKILGLKIRATNSQYLDLSLTTYAFFNYAFLVNYLM